MLLLVFFFITIDNLFIVYRLLSPRRTTSELETFQNHLLMYAGQGFGFSYKNYEARTFLAALDYNHHNQRPVHINKQGHVS